MVLTEGLPIWWDGEYLYVVTEDGELWGLDSPRWSMGGEPDPGEDMQPEEEAWWSITPDEYGWSQMA